MVDRHACCLHTIPRSTLDQRLHEEGMHFQISVLELRVESLERQLQLAKGEIQALRLQELRCVCAGGVADLVDEEFVSQE